MPQPPTAERLTAGEKRLADVIGSQAAATSSSSGENTSAQAPVDLIWDADADRQGHKAF